MSISPISNHTPTRFQPTHSTGTEPLHSQAKPSSLTPFQSDQYKILRFNEFKEALPKKYAALKQLLTVWNAVDATQLKATLTKKQGYFSRLWSNESWSEWTENKTPLGKLVSLLNSYTDSTASPKHFLKYLSPSDLKAANHAAKQLLKKRPSTTHTNRRLNSLTNGLVAYYPFNGNANDESGNGNHGTVYGATPTTDMFGNVNSAYRFDGVYSHIRVPNSNTLNLNGPMSLSAWAYDQTPDTVQMILLKGHWSLSGPQKRQFTLMSSDPPYKVPTLQVFSNNQNWEIVRSSQAPLVGQWFHLAAVYDGSQQKIYLNGVLSGSVPRTYTAFTPTNPAPMYIGAGFDSSIAHVRNGEIDEVRIYNRALSDSEIVSLYNHYLNANPPQLDHPIPDQTVVLDQPFAYPINHTFSEPDGDYPLSFQLGTPTRWLQLNQTHLFGTPTTGDQGTFISTLNATDSKGATTSTTFKTIVPNTAPSLLRTIPKQFANEGFSFSYSLANLVTDPDGDSLLLTVTLANGDPLPSWLTLDTTTLTLSGTPGPGNHGAFRIKVTATDPFNGSVSTEFDMDVIQNNPPVLENSIPNQNAPFQQAFGFSVPSSTFSEPDGEPLTYTATLPDGNPLPSWLTLNPITRTFSGTPQSGDQGTHHIKFTADDGRGGKTSTLFDITVPNRAPIYSGGVQSQTVLVGNTQTIDLSSFFTDADGDTLTFHVSLENGNPTPNSISINHSTQRLIIAPQSGDQGHYRIKVTANDGVGGQTSGTFDLTIPNQAPITSSRLPQQQSTVGKVINYQVPASTFTDLDGDSLTFSMQMSNEDPLPHWLTFNPVTRHLSGTPPTDSQQVYRLSVIANDGKGGISSADLEITVLNRLPQVGTTLTDQKIIAGKTASFSINKTAFSDLDGDTLSISGSMNDGRPLPPWLILDPNAWKIIAIPKSSHIGSHVFRITAHDNKGGSVYQLFSLEVISPNQLQSNQDGTSPLIMGGVVGGGSVALLLTTIAIIVKCCKSKTSNDIAATEQVTNSKILPVYLEQTPSAPPCQDPPPSYEDEVRR